ncbi:MAG: YqgQ family protein [Lactobacillales bacterium]|nr:YqgQ family protein [Lactobacillales bacterium]
MKTLYDVQQLLKMYGIYVYLGKRIYDIELIKIELKNLHQAGLVNDRLFRIALLILHHEHRLEEKRNREKD